MIFIVKLKRKFVTNLILLLFLNLLIKPFWIYGIERSVQNIVGAEHYGFYFSLFSFSILLNIVLDFGLTNYNNRNIAQNNQLLSKYLSNIIILKFLLAILYALVCFIVALAIGYDALQLKMLIFLILNQFIISFTLYLRSNLSGLHLFKTDSFLSVLDRTLMIGICSVLIWGHITSTPFRIEWFVYAQTVAYSLTCLTAFFIVVSKTEFVKIRFDWVFLLVVMKKSFPYALLILLMSFYYRTDATMIERLLSDGKEQAGIYAQAFRNLDAVSMFCLLFAGLLLPIFAKMLKTKQSVEQLIKFSYILLIVPAIILAIASFIYSYDIMKLMYHMHVEESSKIFRILMLGFISNATIYIFSTLLTANGNMKQLNFSAFLGMSINVILNFILIPHIYHNHQLAGLGSAIANFVTLTFVAICMVIITQRLFKFRVNYNLILRLILFLAGVIIIGIITRVYFHNWIEGFLIMVILSFCLAFVIRLFSFIQMFKIIKENN